VNKRNKDLLKLNRLFKKLTTAVLYLGISGINKGSEKVFLRNMRRVETSLYIINSSMSKHYSIGYRTFYCGVNTYVPPEFKNYWISDHHVISVNYRLGINSFNLIPYRGELYTIQFRHASVPYGIETKDIQRYFRNYLLIKDIDQWIDLFYINRGENILFNQGIYFPEFELFDRDKLNEAIRIYQLSCGIKHVADARSRLLNALEHMIASVI
jgi:hypothetical protein